MREINEVICEWREPAVLGEGPLWVEEERALYWLDILGERLYRLAVDDGSRSVLELDQMVTSLVPRAGGGFLGTVRDGFASVDLSGGAVAPIVLPEAELSGNRFNDGKVDGSGRFWAGSMDSAGKLDTGALYRLDADLSLHLMDDGYIIANGPAFSPDGATLYHTDSVRRVVYAFDLAGDGSISGRSELIALRGEEGEPDGMTVDAEGCLWLAHFGGSRLTRFSPRGEALEAVPMPVPNVTSCTFGGTDLATLYITTARLHLDTEALERYPLAGSLFSCRPGAEGLPGKAFAG